ncbi:MAG: tail fiber domain-containing protein [Bacteroides sp.]|nr:tail fiber domain-containing protein [Bacteroides sp.]MCM1086120.1 tail fiber domain-containing protein [Bacteroides sp.]
MKTFFRELLAVSLLLAGLCVAGQAQSVPGAIKYQAVLRDVNGKTLANKANVNLRVSLRMDDPATGQIAYSEDHKGIATNAYGVIHLEIGRGTVTAGKSLHEVPWAGHEIYVQIEIETDGTGYTHMGNAELLTVPYAFYAENASGDNLYENLDDNVLPKFNAANKTLVNSGLSQTGRDLEVDASSVTFVDKAAGTSGYKFPMSAGSRGQVLQLGRDGQLEWGNVSGDGGSSINLDGDGHLLYWNDNNGVDTISALKYNYKNAGRDIELNTNITGTNNLLVSDKLGDGQIWIGDGNSTNLTPRNLRGPVTMDKEGNTALHLDGHVVMDNTTGKTALNLVMKGGIQLIPGQAGAKDTLAVTASEGGGTGGGESLWEMNNNHKDDPGINQMYPKSNLDKTYVGIGTANPSTLFHVYGMAALHNKALFSECDVEFASETNYEGCTPSFQWFKDKSALFVGATSNNYSSLIPEVGSYSVAMGLDAKANIKYGFAIGREATVSEDYGFAIGKEATVSAGAIDAFAIGNNSTVSAANAMALGRESSAAGQNSIALGYNVKATKDYAIALGYDQIAGSDAVVIGYSNVNVGDVENLGSNTQYGLSLAIGRNNNLEKTASIVIGSDNKLNADNGGSSIVIGGMPVGIPPYNKDFKEIPGYSYIVGRTACFPALEGDEYGITLLGSTDIVTNSDNNGLISVGQRNSYEGAPYGSQQDPLRSFPIMLGSNLTNNGAYRSLTMIGDGFFADVDHFSPEEPIFMYGSQRVADELGVKGGYKGYNAVFEISAYGNAFFNYDLNVDGEIHMGGDLVQTSDERLKDSIRPMDWGPALLDKITPVSYMFKSDTIKKRTRFGFIAQDVQKTFPELVTKGAKGMLGMDYIGLIPVLWQINRELLHTIDALQRRVEEQDRKQAELESELQAIKEKLEKLGL